MKLLDLYDILLAGEGHFTTREVASRMRLPADRASKALKRLAGLGRVIRVSRGKWALAAKTNRLKLPELLAGGPAYCTGHTALFRHGMIGQIPEAIHAASPRRGREETTPFGRIKIHRVTPEMFGGWATEKTGAKVATPEKALVDYFYLGAGGAPEFQTLPEMETPPDFSWAKARELSGLIANKSWRTAVRRKLARQKELCAACSKKDPAEC